MIKKGDKNYRAFVGDFKPVNVFAKDNKVAGYVSESASGQELELSNTYNDSYDGLKVFGKSEQKAQWNQAEGVTTQAGTPSPASPIDLVSNIPAGSYQIQTQNGIYEVTLTEDLRGLDDAYRDKICFDSVSGTGYLEQNTQKVNMQGKNISNYSGTDDETLHFGMAYDFDKSKVSNNQFICTHFPFVEGAFYNPTEDSMVIYKNTDTANSLFVNIRKEHLDITDFSDLTENVSSFQRWVSANSPTVILPMTTPIKTALTFTKVTSSTLPVLPWTAYGNNLFDGVFEAGFYDENGTVGSTSYIRSTNYIPVQPNTQYYFLNNKDDDTFLWYDGGKNFIAQVNDLSAPSPANARYMRFFFYGQDLETEYMICNGSKPTAFEPFNPTPPESLSPSPDYPHQIYDLSDVTVTSRGSNIADIPDVETLDYDAEMSKYLQWYIDFPLGTEVTVSADVKINGNLANDWRIQLKDTNTIYLFKPHFNTISFEGRFSYTHIKTVDFNKEDVNYSLWYFGDSENGTVRRWAKNITVNIGNTDMGYDKYRYTQTKIPVVCSALEISKTLYDTLPNDYGRRTENGKYYVCDYVKIENGSVKYVSCISDDIIDGTLSFSIDGENRFFRGGYPYTLASDSIVYCAGTHLPGITHAEAYYNQKSGVSKMNGIISVAKQGIFADMTADDFNSWLVQQNSLGTPFTVRYIRQNPVITDISDTWAQDMIGLKTAPYYTKLFADKETGGLEATYKQF